MEEVGHLLHWNRFLVASDLGSGWGEDERNGKIHRHYLLHRSRSIALAERERAEHHGFGDFFSFENTSQFTRHGGCIALWAQTPGGWVELVDGSDDLKAFSVAADLTNKFRLKNARLYSSQQSVQTQTDLFTDAAGVGIGSRSEDDVEPVPGPSRGRSGQNISSHFTLTGLDNVETENNVVETGFISFGLVASEHVSEARHVDVGTNVEDDVDEKERTNDLLMEDGAGAGTFADSLLPIEKASETF